MYESFYIENVSFLAVSKRKFSEEFHKEARRQYTIPQEVENLKSKSQQLHNRKNPSTAGFLLSENHTLKPHDSSIITMNLNRINQIEKSAQEVEEKMKKDLQSAVLASGKIKDGRKTSHKFSDEDIISDMRELKTKLATTKSRLTVSLGRKPRIYSKLTLELSGESRLPKSKTNTVQQNVRPGVPLKGRLKFLKRSPLLWTRNPFAKEIK